MPSHILLKAAFSLETVAHLRGMEAELLPQAEYLRKLCEKLEKWVAADNEIQQNDSDARLVDIIMKGVIQ